MSIPFQRIVVPLGALALLYGAYRGYGWAGVALVTGALVMWMLLHLNRIMVILRRTAERPIGQVDSAVMLNARLRKGVPLVHVLALTRSLGERISAPDAQPEVFRWIDNTQSHVTCTFAKGRLKHWELVRPGS